ncbi:MAG: hypothetical protein LUC94_14775 [Clostridiales bacterium]|nr:hypothetical protein [Clostridiales bacterium]
MVILESVADGLLHGLSLQEDVRKTLPGGGLGDTQHSIGADTDSTLAGFHIIAQLLGNEGIGGAAGQQNIGVLPGFLEFGSLDNSSGNQTACFGRGENKGGFYYVTSSSNVLIIGLFTPVHCAASDPSPD